jgi:hypothetical protein
VVANVSAEHASFYAAHEDELTPALAALSVRDTAAAMRLWRLRAEATDDRPEAPSHPSEGRRELSGHLPPEDAAVVEAAIAAATPKFDPLEEPLASGAERRAAALVALCRWFLDNSNATSSGSRTRPHVSVVVELKELAYGGPGQLANGAPVPAKTTEWLSCDSELHRIVMPGRSTVLDYGSSVRTISPAVWAALVVRDRHCRHPGCDRPPSWCEAHHVVHFSRGGPTRLDSLVLACTRHHHLWHDHGWQLNLARDGTLRLVSAKALCLRARRLQILWSARTYSRGLTAPATSFYVYDGPLGRRGATRHRGSEDVSHFHRGADRCESRVATLPRPRRIWRASDLADSTRGTQATISTKSSGTIHAELPTTGNPGNSE